MGEQRSSEVTFEESSSQTAPQKLIKILVLLEKLKFFFLGFFFFVQKQLKDICGDASFRSRVKRFILRVKVEGVCNALSPIKLKTSADMEVFM